MYVPCILSDSAIFTLFKSMWTLFGHLKKKTKSGQPAKAPMLQLDPEEEGGDNDNAASRTSSQAPSTQLPSMTQAGPSQAPHDRRPRPVSSGSGKCVDEAILKLADRLSQNTGMQDRLATAVQESAKPCLTLCQWMGLEMSMLDEELWTGFMCEAFNLVEHYRTVQAKQLAPPPPPPSPQAAQYPPV